MSEETRKRDPSTASANWELMAPIWGKIGTILAGTDAMRSAGERYLPRHENEKMQRYTDRLHSTTLKNTTALTLDSWVGRPFSDPVTVDEEIPPALIEDLDNIDLQGNNITVFAREWFREGLSKAFAHVLIDHPIPQGTPETRTLADDRSEGLRPYWSLIKPENLIFAASDVIDGREVLTHIRIREVEVVRDGFAEAIIERIRIFDRALAIDPVTDQEVVGVFFSTWVKQTEKNAEKWVLETPPTPIDLDVIPLVTFYSSRDDLMLGKPPLEDLVDLNIEHWQSKSDQRSILTMGRFPMLAASGLEEDEANLVVVGPKTVLTTPVVGAKWYYVEPEGTAIAAGVVDLEAIERCMAEYGADFLRKRPAGETATARALDSAEASSPLQDSTLRFQDALNQALDLSARWRKLEVPTGAKLRVANDFGPEDFFPGDVDTLTKARQARDLSRENYLAELKRRGALNEDFDSEENAQQLEEEASTSLADAGVTPGDIDPQQDDADEE